MRKLGWVTSRTFRKLRQADRPTDRQTDMGGLQGSYKSNDDQRPIPSSQFAVQQTQDKRKYSLLTTDMRLISRAFCHSDNFIFHFQYNYKGKFKKRNFSRLYFLLFDGKCKFRIFSVILQQNLQIFNATPSKRFLQSTNNAAMSGKEFQLHAE